MVYLLRKDCCQSHAVTFEGNLLVYIKHCIYCINLVCCGQLIQLLFVHKTLYYNVLNMWCYNKIGNACVFFSSSITKFNCD